MKTKKRSVNWDRVFGSIASSTFAIQLIALLILLTEGLVFFLMLTGLLDIALTNIDLLLFFLLFGGGVAFLIFIWLLGFFLRFHGRIRRFIIGEGVGKIETDDPATKTILGLFGGAVFFILCAGLYGFYLLWKYILDPWGTALLAAFGYSGIFIYELGFLVLYGATGALIIGFIIQLVSAAINRYAGRLVSSVT